MKREVLKAPLGEADAAGRQTVAIVSRRTGARFLLEKWRREIEAADAEDRRALQSAIAAIDREAVTDGKVAALLGSLTGTQARLLLRLAQVGHAVTRGARETIRAERVDELREFLATRPVVRNVAELRALPDLPKSARLLSDATLRRKLRDAGVALSGGRPRKT